MSDTRKPADCMIAALKLYADQQHQMNAQVLLGFYHFAFLVCSQPADATEVSVRSVPWQHLDWNGSVTAPHGENMLTWRSNMQELWGPVATCLLAYRNSLSTLSQFGAEYDSVLEWVYGDNAKREGIGAFYTPPALTAVCLEYLDLDVSRVHLPVVLDPSCGTGNFLVAVIARIWSLCIEHERAVDVEELLQTVRGVELDSVAAHVCRLRLTLLAYEMGVTQVDTRPLVITGDALLGEDLTGRTLGLYGLPLAAKPLNFAVAFPDVALLGGFTAVVGNPPFLAAHRTRTAADAHTRSILDARFLGLRTATTDIASLFLCRALALCQAEGRVAFVQPLSVLSTDGAAPTRAHVAQTARLRAFWWSPKSVFQEANVRTCVLVLEKTQRIGTQAPRLTSLDPADAVSARGCEVLGLNWGSLCLDGPSRLLPTDHGVLGQLVAVTADFREQFYGLADYVAESPRDIQRGCVPLITNGLIDPMEVLWGKRPCKFCKKTYERPVVDLQLLQQGNPKLATWASNRLQPKAMMSTQSSLLEVCLDIGGNCLNTTPTLTLKPHSGQLEDLLWVVACLHAPPLVRHAETVTKGSGMSASSIKMSAKGVMQLPLPAPRHFEDKSWDDYKAEALALTRLLGGRLDSDIREECLLNLGETMNKMYGGTVEDFVWWAQRLTGRSVESPE